MKTRVTLFASLLLAVGLIATGCRTDREGPKPNPTHEKKEYLVEASIYSIDEMGDLKVLETKTRTALFANMGEIDGLGRFKEDSEVALTITPKEPSILFGFYEKNGKGGFTQKVGTQLGIKEKKEIRFKVKDDMHFVVVFADERAPEVPLFINEMAMPNGVILKDGSLGTGWMSGDKLTFYGLGERIKTPISWSAEYIEGVWVPKRPEENNLHEVTNTIVTYVPEGAGKVSLVEGKVVLEPKRETNVRVGGCMLNWGYQDVLLASSMEQLSNLSATMMSPYTQLRLIVRNGKMPKQIKDLTVSFEGAKGRNAKYTNEKWSGEKEKMVVSFPVEEQWGKDRETSLYIALPMNKGEELKATISYSYQGVKKSRERVLTVDDSIATVVFAFEEVARVGELSIGSPILDSEGKLIEEWGRGDVVQLWARGKELKNTLNFSATRGYDDWSINARFEEGELETVEAVEVAYLPYGGVVSVTPKGEVTFAPKRLSQRMSGSFTVAPYYESALIGRSVGAPSDIRTTLHNPMRILKVVTQNCPYPQSIADVTVRVKGGKGGEKLSYAQEKWSGEPEDYVAKVVKNRSWKGREKDSVYMAIPTNERTLEVSLSYRLGQKSVEKNVTQKVTLEEGLSTVVFNFEEEVIENPPLKYTPLVNEDFWREANKRAYEEVFSNYAGEHTVEEAMNLDWCVSGLMLWGVGTRDLYREEEEFLKWSCLGWNGWNNKIGDPKEKEKRWCFAIGLQDLSGKVVEVFPPFYVRNQNYGATLPGCFITVPEGEYRVVCFVSYPENWKDEGRWYKLPMFQEWLHQHIGWQDGKGKYDHLVKTLVPMDKNPTKDSNRVYVVDRKKKGETTPRWKELRRYANNEDYERKVVKSKHAEDITQGEVLGMKLVNNSNQRVKGTIVVKAEYKHCFHPDAYWWCDEIRKMNRESPEYSSREPRIQYKEWSHEVNRIEVVLEGNSSKEVAMPMKTLDPSWSEEGGMSWKGVSDGGASQIAFYWVDEKGKEMLIKRDNSDFMNAWERHFNGDQYLVQVLESIGVDWGKGEEGITNTVRWRL
ncbi:hypothetical protein IX306_000009 [Porphyromonas levii]|uniref:hypothetical protein n=1 Tax=Porphyromonas levii TaxID=28114 RepID=UPI001BA5C0C7|nr:hypothetical protein [Porphyromonas levii]MBR8765569.1 hypothetical protein [Porphyromonas levii]MBR8772909.1 hypothetical protein [Porphyromonas levii]